MIEILLGLLLAIIWMAITGLFTLPNLLLGAAIGLVAMLLMRDRIGGRLLWRRAVRILGLAWIFLRELVISALSVARFVLTPNLRAALRPGFVAFPLTVTSDAEIALLANLITLTPGTLSVDVSADRKVLYIHALDVSDPDKLVAGIAKGFEARIIEVFK